MIKNIKNLSGEKKIILTICVLVTFIFDFFYANWISYRIALSHFELEFYIPLYIFAISTIAFVVLKIIEMNRHKELFIKYLVAIVAIGAIFAYIFCGYCPACNEVHNPIYRFLYKIFKGTEYIYCW